MISSIAPLTAMLYAAILLKPSLADLGEAIHGVEMQASNLKTLVDQWSSGQGLQGALSIQEKFPELSKAVGSLSEVASSVTEGAIDAGSVNSLASSISSLLQALTAKAGDFKGVGASDIVANDISSLKQPAENIISNFVKAVSGDCAKAASLSPALHTIGQGFSSADANYGLPAANFPVNIPCAGNKVASSAPSEQSASSAPGKSMPPAGPSTQNAGYPYPLPSMAPVKLNQTAPVVQSNDGISHYASKAMTYAVLAGGAVALLL